MGEKEDAGKIKQLADDLRKLLDQPIVIAADEQHKDKDDQWQGPTADRVRGELKVRKQRLGSMADDLDDAATRRAKEPGSGAE